MAIKNRSFLTSVELIYNVTYINVIYVTHIVKSGAIYRLML